MDTGVSKPEVAAPVVPLLVDVPLAFTTERLDLRCPREGDGAIVFPAARECLEDLVPWMPWATPTYDQDNSEGWCRRAHSKFISREELSYLFFLRGTGTYVGTCSMHHIVWSVPSVEIGYWLRTRYRGQGYMTEAVQALSRVAFDRLKAERVEIRCDERNQRSARVAERAGFEFEGTRRHDARTPEGFLRNTRVYSRLRPPPVT